MYATSEWESVDMLQNPIVRIILAILVLTIFLGACVLGPIFYDGW
jgi:hypothetical protein